MMNAQQEEIDKLNEMAYALFRQESSQAIVCAEQAAELSIQNQYHYGFTRALFNQGRLFILQGRLEEAIALLRHAIFLAGQHDFKTIRAESLQELARAYYASADYNAALDAWTQCLDAALSANEKETYLLAQIGLGQLYYSHDDFIAALDHHQHALEHANRQTPAHLLSAIHINIGTDELSLGHFETAAGHLQKGLVNAQKAGSLEYESDALGALARAYTALGDFIIARQLLEQAIAICIRHGYLWGLAHNQLALGQLKIKSGQPESACEILEQSLELARAISAPHMIYMIEHALHDAYEQLGQLGKALQYLKDCYAHHCAILRQASPHKLQTMEMRLEVEKARGENIDLRRQHAEERRARQRIEKLASQDPLTGLLNRRGLELRAQLKKIAECSEPAAILMIDVDHFKRINDRHGHDVGDKVLRQIAALLKSGCRQDDQVCRWGGEEFVVLLPARNGASSTEVAERLRSMVEQWSWSKVAEGLEVTISVGIANHACESRITNLIRRADQRLYQAKQAGRNRVAA